MAVKLFVLYGGKSPEHEVSLRTAFTVLGALDRCKYDVYPVYITREGLWCCEGLLKRNFESMDDLAFQPESETAAHALGSMLVRWMPGTGKQAVVLPLLHGANGEDGTVQGLLELLDVAYVGNGVLSAALTLDKEVTKRLLEQAGIGQANYRSFRLDDWRQRASRILEEAERSIGYPCYVKPASLGSSIGISRCEDRVQLREGIETAFRYDSKLVIEEEIDGREIQVAVLGNERPLASLPGEFIHRNRFFDYESKYMDKELIMSVPAAIPPEAAERVRRNAIRAYRLLECSGLARVDFFLNEENELFLNEVNALPGFTGTSMYPVMWECTDGTTYGELIDKLIDYALKRHMDRQAIRYAR